MGTIRQTATIQGVTPRELYDAFLDSRRHSAMTGAKAKISARVGASWSAWDDFLTGTNVELAPGKRIVQTWRGTDFPDDHYSTATFTFARATSGTRISLVQTDVPDDLVSSYAEGWRDSYWIPMKRHFGRTKVPRGRAER
ncbi:MAG: SRPBCC domain-containing protein [Chloroflexi bacterium]|nr:SRPBCC domain-containing protein [Chloroflexota bacterium]